MTSKIRIKLGSVEIEYEGDEQFLKTDLPQLLKTLLSLQSQENLSDPEDNEAPEDKKPAGKRVKLATSSIVAKLGYKKGPDLLLAAAAYLTFAEGKDSFGRLEILKAAKTATAYYKASIRANLSNHLNSLVRSGKLNEQSPGMYALQNETRNTIEKSLGH